MLICVIIVFNVDNTNIMSVYPLKNKFNNKYVIQETPKDNNNNKDNTINKETILKKTTISVNKTLLRISISVN